MVFYYVISFNADVKLTTFTIVTQLNFFRLAVYIIRGGIYKRNTHQREFRTGMTNVGTRWLFSRPASCMTTSSFIYKN